MSGIHGEQTLEKVQLVLVGFDELLPELLFTVDQAFVMKLQEMLERSRFGPRLIRGLAQQTVDHQDLFDFAITRKDDVPIDELADHHADRPEIGRRAVLTVAEQKLRRTVPCRWQAMQLASRVIHIDRYAEVGDFDHAVIVDHDVARFDILVHDAGGVDVLETGEHHEDHGLHVAMSVVIIGAVDYSLERERRVRSSKAGVDLTTRSASMSSKTRTATRESGV